MATIAVIEDEEILRELISEQLRESDYTVQTAENGRAGWEMVQREKPDLILLDLLMPQMSGYDFLKLLRSHLTLRQIPCIVISNSGQIHDLQRAYECGANDILIKAEFNPDEVVQKVRDLLASKRVA